MYQYYLPIYFWMRDQLEQHKAQTNGKQRPLTIGMQAPQVDRCATLILWRLHPFRTGLQTPLCTSLPLHAYEWHMRGVHEATPMHAGLWQDHHCGGPGGSVQA